MNSPHRTLVRSLVEDAIARLREGGQLPAELVVPEYVIEDEGPDHMKTFTAQVRVGDGLYGNGVGRSKKEAEQQAAEAAYSTLADELPVPAEADASAAGA